MPSDRSREAGAPQDGTTPHSATSTGPSPLPSSTSASPATPSRRLVLGAGPLALVGTAAGVPLLAGCDSIGGGSAVEPDLRAEVDPEPPGDPESAQGVAAPFTASMLQGLAETDPGSLNQNTTCSPLSALMALAMVGLGAKGGTLTQMEEVLGGSIQETLAPFAATLRPLLASVGDEEREADDEDAPDPAQASLANATWIQEDLDVEEQFLEDLSRWFDSGLFTADFTDDHAREDAREDMNEFAEVNTNGLIKDLVSENALSTDTRLTLINALHLKAAWHKELEDAGTDDFTLPDGSTTAVPMLKGKGSGWYEDSAAQATSLPTYGDELSLVVVRPQDTIGDVLATWSHGEPLPGEKKAALPALLDAVLNPPEDLGTIDLTLPGFDLSTDLELAEVLTHLGMTDLFTAGADLTGIAPDLFVSGVIQKAVTTVDEKGMEAAAATAAVVDTTSADIPGGELTLDNTQTPLVVGWVADPAAREG
jgi:serpin B